MIFQPPAGRITDTELPAEVETPDHELVDLLGDYLPGQRWFAARSAGRPEVEISCREPIAQLPDRIVERVLVSVRTPAGTDTYQLWIGWAKVPPSRVEHSVIGPSGDLLAYEALQDQEFTDLLLPAIADGAALGPLTCRPEPDAEIDRTAPGLVLTGEQSNTSIIYGHSAILKVFRRVEPGPNPDAEVHRALHAIGSRQVAAPLGEIIGQVDGRPTTLALLTAFFPGSADGWAMATTSVRDLMAEGDLRADEVGGDFSAEAYRLGQAVAAVHADLATAFGTAELGPEALAEMVEQMSAEARSIAALVPALADQLDRILDTLARAAAVPGPTVAQRIHGDLHLGQALRTMTGWAIIDFEGEPSKPLAFRQDRHSPLKDIAGMLRSFDYAAHHWFLGGNSDAQHLYRAAEWAERNRAAFCEGYAATSGADPRQAAELLTAFELDKALYEVAYEHGHRPGWEPIPLQAVNRLIGNGGRT